MPNVSLLATLLATALSFALGALWYGPPLFAKAWMAEIGRTEAEVRAGFDPARTFGGTFVLALSSSYVFGMFVGPEPGLARSIGVGLMAGLFFAAFSLATNDLFERRSTKLTLINGGYHTVRFGLLGLAFGLLG